MSREASEPRATLPQTRGGRPSPGSLSGFFLALLPAVFGSPEASGTWSLATSKRGMRIRASGTGRDGDDRTTDRGAYGNTAWRVAVWGEAMRNWVTPINPRLMSL
jgi:hypothetical protein